MIHSHYTCVRIYYAKFPNEYLQNIVKLGANYDPTQRDHVTLHRTKKFHIEMKEDRVELFRLIARLLAYLNSGNSHVGYLHNYPENPIHSVV